jgi:flagellar operon protein
MIKNVNIQPSSIQPQQPAQQGKAPADASVFKGVLDGEMSKTLQTPQKADVKLPDLKFSSHAIDRIQSRGIKLQPEDIKNLGHALAKAKDKGSKNALVLMGDNAFVMSVKDNTVITAMDKNMMKENVFTNIDSTILI